MVVGAGPTGVEMAGQIRELASKTLRKEFRNFDPRKARVILVDGAPYPLPVFGDKLGAKTAAALEKLGVELAMNSLVTAVDADSVTLKAKDGTETVIPSICKVWAAGVQGSPLGKIIAEKTGAELDRAGRVQVNPDLTSGNAKNIYVVGDLMSVAGVPGVAQGAIQSARYVADRIKAQLAGRAPSEAPFSYHDKGSMATIAKFQAVMSVGKVQMGGFFAWLGWCFLHLLYIAGFKAQVSTLLRWFISFMSNARSSRTTTNQQMVARLALEKLGARSSGKLVEGQEH